ncbi:MAG: Activator of Hsp90 ATPase 1-like protein [Pseudomonadota bacterium]|jgi:uncharacterized protein YndB with AHSA1/START domain
MAARTRGFAHRADIDAAPAAVWQALLDPAAVAQWLGGPAEVQPRPGGIHDACLPGAPPRRTSIDVLEAGRRLRLLHQLTPGLPSFRGAVAEEFLLEPAGAGTVIRLLASGYPEDPAWDDAYRSASQGMRRALMRLKVWVERARQPPAG